MTENQGPVFNLIRRARQQVKVLTTFLISLKAVREIKFNIFQLVALTKFKQTTLALQDYPLPLLLIHNIWASKQVNGEATRITAHTIDKIYKPQNYIETPSERHFQISRFAFMFLLGWFFLFSCCDVAFPKYNPMVVVVRFLNRLRWCNIYHPLMTQRGERIDQILPSP